MTSGVVAACSGGGSAHLDTLAPVPVSTVPVSPVVVTSVVSGTVVSSTVVSAVSTSVVATSSGSVTVVEVGGPVFSDALGVRVDGAPGVRTRGDTRQLMSEGLYVHIAWEPDSDDASVFTVQPDDVEILEAYANGALTFYRAATSTLSIDSPDFDENFVDGGEKFRQAFDQARAGGYVKSLGAGAVLRPYVLGDNRTDTSAVVLDCTLTYEQWVSPSNPAIDLQEPVAVGTVATIVRVGDRWVTDTVSAEPTACL